MWNPIKNYKENKKYENEQWEKYENKIKEREERDKWIETLNLNYTESSLLKRVFKSYIKSTVMAIELTKIANDFKSNNLKYNNIEEEIIKVDKDFKIIINRNGFTLIGGNEIEKNEYLAKIKIDKNMTNVDVNDNIINNDKLLLFTTLMFYRGRKNYLKFKNDNANENKEKSKNEDLQFN